MKIKIIELLNKSSNGEEMPKRIKYDLKEYFYCGYDYKIYDVEKQFDDDYNLWNNLDMYKLNDYVEIIEEPNKIKYPILHKTAPNETTGDQMPNWRNLIDCNFEYLNKTICQLIDEINNLKEK